MTRFRPSRLLRGGQLLTALVLLFGGTTTYAQGDLSRAIPPSGKALVFVFRADRDPVSAQVPVVVNKQLVGALADGTFVTATVDPGRTELRIGQRLVKTLAFDAVPNLSYFVRVEALTAVRIEAQSVSEPEGRRAIAQSRLVGPAPVVVIPPAITPPVVTPPVTPPPVAAPAVVTPPPPVAPTVVTPPAEAAVTVTPPAIVAAPVPEPVTVKPAAAPGVPAPTEPSRESKFALIASTGTFKLANESQTVAGLSSTYDTTSTSVFGVEAEWRSGSGFSVGGEFFSYQNDLVTAGTNPNAQQRVYAVMLNGKYYFRAADWLYPFVGAGIGQANASYSGGLTGNTTGLAYQGLAGLEVRYKAVGLYLQYKYLASELGDKGKEVKVGGSGVLGGVSISF